MNTLVLGAAVGGLVSVGLGACNPNSIGRPCINPTNSPVTATQISSPALECPSRLCLLQPPNASTGISSLVADGGARQTCTAGCDNNDDCIAETKDRCRPGFVCAVAVQADPTYCCKKMCVCRDDLIEGFNVDPDGGIITPHSCESQTYSTSCPICPNVVSKLPSHLQQTCQPK